MVLSLRALFTKSRYASVLRSASTNLALCPSSYAALRNVSFKHETPKHYNTCALRDIFAFGGSTSSQMQRPPRIIIMISSVIAIITRPRLSPSRHVARIPTHRALIGAIARNSERRSRPGGKDFLGDHAMGPTCPPEDDAITGPLQSYTDGTSPLVAVATHVTRVWRNGPPPITNERRKE